VSLLTRRIQIAVLGSSKEICTKKTYQLAVQVGEEIAKIGAVTLTGGGHGVMEAAMKGARKQGGLTLGILPWGKMEHYNEFCDIVIATGIGFSRDSINLNSADGAIIVGGGAGTMNEATYAYIEDIPMVAIAPSGGMAKKLAGTFLDERRTERVRSAQTPKEALRKVLEEIDKKKKVSKRPGYKKRTVDY
jgi:uncharacterized protein (TIGR00725 family)